MPANRMHPGLVALSATAVAAIYMAGYLRTQSADASIGAAAVPTQNAPILGAATPAITAPAITAVPRVTAVTPVGIPTRVTPSAPAATATPIPITQPVVGFKDGTYTGQGTSRRGDVWVSVDVQGGHIASVTITRSTLQYPLRDIAGLPAQVVQRQSAQVDLVSRATYSSQAFRTAVSQALSKAA
jgi:uncharacterized protein with FMN-binding domain